MSVPNENQRQGRQPGQTSREDLREEIQICPSASRRAKAVPLVTVLFVSARKGKAPAKKTCEPPRASKRIGSGFLSWLENLL
jgi:hypothetical protein